MNVRQHPPGACLAAALLILSGCHLGRATYGRGGPIVVQQVADDGSWFTACEATGDLQVGWHGDVSGEGLELRLFNEPGAGEPIEGIYASSADDRFVAVKRNGSLFVVDSAQHEWIGPLLPGPPAYGDDVPVTFSNDARSVFAVAEGKAHVFDLESRELQSFELGEGSFGRPARAGSRLVLARLDEDTDQNGKLEWRTVATTLFRGRCVGRPLPYSTWGYVGDRANTRVIQLGSGDTLDLRGEPLVLGDELVIQRDGGLLAIDHGGTEVPFELPGCDTDVVHLDHPRRQLVYECRARRGLRIWSRGDGVRILPGLRAGPTGGHEKAPRLLWVEGGPETTVFDLQTLETHRLEGGPIYAFLGTAVIHAAPKSELRWTDLLTGQSRRLGHSTWSVFETASSRFAAIQGRLIDLRTGAERGYFPTCDMFSAIASYFSRAPRCSPLIAVDASGRALLSRIRFSYDGPLHWTDPAETVGPSVTPE